MTFSNLDARTFAFTHENTREALSRIDAKAIDSVAMELVPRSVATASGENAHAAANDSRPGKWTAIDRLLKRSFAGITPAYLGGYFSPLD